MKRLLAFVLNVALILLPLQHPVFAAMSGGSFQIPWDAMGDGGGEQGASANFTANDTLGLQANGLGSSASYQLSAGYRVVESGPTLSLFVRSQDNATQVAFTAFSNASKTVTVSAVGSYAVGDTITVVEDQGFSQKIAVGKIVSILGNVFTVDGWAGDNAAISAIPAGGNDFVYRMSNTSIAFGTITPGTENTGVTVSSATADTSAGFSVYVQANQVLQNGSAQTITSVGDGTVSLGSEEYGANVTGPTAFGVGDLAVDTSQRLIQTKATSTSMVPDRVGMGYKLSVTSSTNAGTYTQSVFYTLTANF